MSTLFYTARSESITPSDTLENVRSTVTTVDKAADASVATTTPERGRLETDPVTEGGLTTHQVSSTVNPSVKAPPQTVSHAQHNDALNASWSGAGTAADREARGEWGHGTAYSQDAIERIPDGIAFSETYFARDRRAPNEQIGDYMSADAPTNRELEAAAASAREQMREAQAANPYQQMYDARMGN